MSIQLIACPACGGKVSSQAIACPHCGQPICMIQQPAPRGNATLSDRKNWSPFASGSLITSKNGPTTSALFTNVGLTPEAILQRVRAAFEHHGFSVKQDSVQSGTATTVGGFSSGGNGGLVGAFTSIEKKNWNPFLASHPGSKLIEAQVSVLNVRQHMQAQNALSSSLQQDIEVHAKIEYSSIACWIITAVVLLAFIAGLFCGFLHVETREEVETKVLITGIIFAVGGAYFGTLFISEYFWTRPKIKRFESVIDKVINSLPDYLN